MVKVETFLYLISIKTDSFRWYNYEILTLKFFYPQFRGNFIKRFSVSRSQTGRRRIVVDFRFSVSLSLIHSHSLAALLSLSLSLSFLPLPDGWLSVFPFLSFADSLLFSLSLSPFLLFGHSLLYSLSVSLSFICSLHSPVKKCYVWMTRKNDAHVG